MRNTKATSGVLVGCVLLFCVDCVRGQDWPQWRGANRDNKVVGFSAPKTWPKELTKKWQVTVGLGEASPILVGDKVYTFGRIDKDEVTTCLDAASGSVLWRDKYAALAVTNAAKGHPGPRSTPAVADGKVCTFGVAGVLSCLDAASGQVVWRKDSKAWPKFFTASSPVIVEGKCIIYLGKPGKGEIVAYDLATGAEKWKWTGAGPPYGSPVVMTVAGTKQLVTPTEKSIVGISVADGTLLWQNPFSAKYMNNTPIVDGQTVIYSADGSGTIALKIDKEGDRFTAKELWKKTQASHRYNTPVLKDGMLFGLAPSGGKATSFFCMNAQTGDVLWKDSGKRGECGTILDAGPVLLSLSSNSELVAFEPSKTGYKQIAHYKVADTPTWSYPIIAGNRVYVKGSDTLALWTIE